MASLPKRVGWIGLGNMGLPMLANLVKKMDHDTQFFVNDIVPELVQMAVDQGDGRTTVCKTAKEIADDSDLIISMVPEGSHVRSVYLDKDAGVLSSDLQSKILVDCSTIDTASSLAVRDAVADQHPKACFYDAPVSGGVLGAEKGSLTFMIGCGADDANATLLTEVLGLMGSNIVPCGGASLGLTAKLCNNYTSALISIAVSEAMTIGIRSGMDPRVLANVFHTSTAQSSICDNWNPVPGLSPEAPASHGYKPGFRVQLMKKDFSLAVDTAKRVGAQLALGESGLSVFEGAARDPKCKDLDARVVYRFLGGDENWRERFPEEVKMKTDETKMLLRRGKELS